MSHSMRRAAFVLAGCMLFATGRAGAAPFARRIDANNLAESRLAGTDATGAVGDWLVGDGTVCAVVSDLPHESDFSPVGGQLVDLGRCGRADDQFIIFDQLRNFSVSGSVPAREIRIDANQDTAAIIVAGERDGIRIATRYEVRAGAPGRLFAVSDIERAGDGPSVFGFAAAFANAYTLQPFVASVSPDGPARGFSGPAFLGRGTGAIAEAAIASESVVLVGGNSIEPGVSYAIRIRSAERVAADGARTKLPVFLLADDSASLFAIFVRPFWIGGEDSLGWTQLLQTKWMDLAKGERVVVETEMAVGDRSDVASSIELLRPGQRKLRGSVDDASARIHIDRTDGRPFTEVQPNADGSFEVGIEPGSYRMRVEAPGGRRSHFDVEVSGADPELGRIAVGAPGRVELPRGVPMRLVFLGRDGTPDPAFGDDLLGFQVIGKDEMERPTLTRDVHLSGGPSDPESVVVAPGKYRVLATRGMEYTVTEASIDVVAGKTSVLSIDAPERAFDTPGWISADLHVHGARSLDSALADHPRITAFVAEGAEVLVSTDHDAVTDYGPAIRALGVAPRVASVVGVEITGEAKTEKMPHTIGHGIAFPYRGDPNAYRDGVPNHEGQRWRDVLPVLRQQPGERVLQLNHARYPGLKYHPRGYFTHLGFVGEPYDPTKPLTEWPNRVLVEPAEGTGARDIDFDAMEILNGKRTHAYEDSSADWHSLLKQGIVLSGTANSDSHVLDQISGMPRNYVALADDSVAGFDEGKFVAAIRSQRMVGTTGPFVVAELGPSRIGERYEGAEGTLRVEVRAAPWILLRRVRVMVNGRVEADKQIREPGVWEFPLRFAKDGYVTVEVRGEAGPTYSAILPGFEPIAFTNPIFVDADGDRRWTPPGF